MPYLEFGMFMAELIGEKILEEEREGKDEKEED
jgi:hypothetical protein